MERDTRLKFHKANWFCPLIKLNFHIHENWLIVDAAVDIEYHFRSIFVKLKNPQPHCDFDLRRHQEFSKKKMQYFDPVNPETGKPFETTYRNVVETLPLSRFVLAALVKRSPKKTIITDGDKVKERTYLKFHPALVPNQGGTFTPLVKKDGLPASRRYCQIVEVVVQDSI
jgi:glycyl-tRNA synthetase